MTTSSISLSAVSTSHAEALMGQAQIRFDVLLRGLIKSPFFSREGLALASNRAGATTRAIHLDDGQWAALDRMATILAPVLSKGKPNRSRTVAALLASTYLRDYKPRVRDFAAEAANLARVIALSKDPAEWARAHRVYAAEQQALADAKRSKRRAAWAARPRRI